MRHIFISMSSIDRQIELQNRKWECLKKTLPLKDQTFERQREALLQVEQQVRDLAGPDPLFPRNVEDNAMDLRVLLYKRFFLLGWMLKASPEEYERMRIVNQFIYEKTVQLREAAARIRKKLKTVPKDDFVHDIEMQGNLSYSYDDEQSVLPMECDAEYGSDYRLMISVNSSLQPQGLFCNKGLEFYCRFTGEDTFYNLDDGMSWGHEFELAPSFEGICICHSASAFVSQLGYPVFDLLRMNDFDTEIHFVYQNFDYIKKHKDL